MAENKKSFLLYCDLIHTITKMPNDKAGELFKHILKYVNDENPETDDLIIQLTFEPIKQQLKRDLNLWENERNQRSLAGKKGMEARWNNKDNTVITDITNDNSVIKPITNITDNVNVTVNDTVNVNVKKKYSTPTLFEVQEYFKANGYSNADKAFQFYNEANWHDSKGNKVKNWKQKMQGVWFKEENKIKIEAPRKLLVTEQNPELNKW